jgi:hypothetical protein
MSLSALTSAAARTAAVLALGAGLLAAPLRAEIPQESGDLMNAIEVIRANMPLAGSEGFVPPSSMDLSRWRLVCDAFLDERPEAVDSLVNLFFPSYEIVTFIDHGFEDREYRLLRETIPPTLAWGTYVRAVDYQRLIAIEVPHGRYETNTPSEGIDIFRRTGALLFEMNGAHRCANSAFTPCDGTSDVCGTGRYHASDMGHMTQTAFQVMHEEYTKAHPGGYSFSIHGMSQTNCSDIFLSNGTATGSTQMLRDMKDSMNESGDIIVCVAGDGTCSCTLNGTTNVQGRCTNGSSQPCYLPASGNNGRFIHAEQLRRVRDNYAIYSKFIAAINGAIDSLTSSGGLIPPDAALYLSVPWPNPSGTEMQFSLFSRYDQDVTVELFDISGAKVGTLYRGAVWRGAALDMKLRPGQFPSGVFFIRATGNSASANRKVVLVR